MISEQEIERIKSDMAHLVLPDNPKPIRFWDLLDYFFNEYKKEDSEIGRLEVTVRMDIIITKLMKASSTKTKK